MPAITTEDVSLVDANRVGGAGVATDPAPHEFVAFRISRELAVSDLSVDAHALVVDNDGALRTTLANYLNDNCIRVTAVATRRDIAAIMSRETVDVLILDLRMSGDDAMHTVRSLREDSGVPIIVLSGRRDEADRVMALELGADDYLTKPFSCRELLARIRALLRRSRAPEVLKNGSMSVRAYRFDGWELNLRLFRLKSPDGSYIGISRGEFGLLRAFLCSPQRILSREQLLGLTHINSLEVYDRSIDVQIMRLRRKIEPDLRHPQFIKTERGAGYYFDASVTVVR